MFIVTEYAALTAINTNFTNICVIVASSNS